MILQGVDSRTGPSFILSNRAMRLACLRWQSSPAHQADEKSAIDSIVPVYDSGSTDNTLETARQFGAHVTQHTYAHSTAAFGGDESAHRNWGLRNIRFKLSKALFSRNPNERRLHQNGLYYKSRFGL